MLCMICVSLSEMLNELPVVFVDDGDTVELITVEITVEHSADPEMINIICNILVLQTDISNFNIICITDNV